MATPMMMGMMGRMKMEVTMRMMTIMKKNKTKSPSARNPPKE
jgi:hypothetical protein